MLGTLSLKSTTNATPTASCNTPAVAVVGVACKLPGSEDLESLWKVLMQHDSCIKPISVGQDKDARPFGFGSLLHPSQRDGFDPSFWGLTPAQAAAIDPQARWILEGVWNSLIDSNIGGMEALADKSVGMYCGVMNNDINGVRNAAQTPFSLNACPGSVAGLVSHVFGFRGPSFDVNSMCSSGLVCLELAVDALKAGKCDVAFVAAANWVGGTQGFIDIGSVNALSPDGLQDCLGRHPNGYVRGEGMVTLMLRRKGDVGHGETFHCILEAIASTHHGKGGDATMEVVSSNVALPSPESYVGSYKRCFSLNPHLQKEKVVYVEMHATGTVRGDAAELDSLKHFYSDPDTAKSPFFVGGNKSIFGHTEPVSGLLSIIKIVLAAKKGTMPPTLFVTDPAKKLIDLSEQTNVRITAAPLPMTFVDSTGSGLYAATSSGMSGTTTHVLLSFPSVSAHVKHQGIPQIVSAAAHSVEASKTWVSTLKEHCDGHDIVLPRSCFLRGKKGAAVCSAACWDGKTVYDGTRAVRDWSEAVDPEQSSSESGAPVALFFGGVGLVQYGVGRELYSAWPSFRRIVDEVDHHFAADPLSPFAGQSVAKACGMTEDTLPLGSTLETKLMQAATFLAQYAQAVAFTTDFSVDVQVAMGHSFGETVAAAVCGAISLSAAVSMTVARTNACLRLEQMCWSEPMGMLICTNVSHQDVVEALRTHNDVYLSGTMSINEYILSGPKQHLQEIVLFLQEQSGAMCNWVDSTIPFHSPHVALVGESLLECAEALAIKTLPCSMPSNQPKQGFVMTSIGTATVTAGELEDATFWKWSAENPILFDDAQQTLERCMAEAPPNTKLIDFSPRGLFSQWLKRNGEDSSIFKAAMVVAPVFSADFVRVFRHYRSEKHGNGQHAVPRFLPTYPFNKRDLSKDVRNVRVQTFDQGGNQSNFGIMNNLETTFVDLDHGTEASINVKDGVVIHFGALPTEEQWVLELIQQNMLLVDFEQSGDILEAMAPISEKHGTMTLVVLEPMDWKNQNDLEPAIRFAVQLQTLLSSIEREIGAVCISRCSENPCFEFIAGSIATLRMQVANLRFACTVRLHGAGLPENAIEWKRIFKAAEAGEDVLQFSKSGDIQGRRIVSSEESLSWDTSWVKEDALYVISGGSSGIASGILPGLAAVGVQHFLLMVNSRQPDKTALGALEELGATTVAIRKCDLTDECSVQTSIDSVLEESGAKRVGGVFHLAGIDSDQAIPVPEAVLKQVVSVKYHGHRTLMKCSKLQRGDIFSVPGSISQLIGSGGVAYAATNHACRALQLQLARRGVIAPYPILNYTEELWDKSTLWHGPVRSKVLKQMRNTGMKANAMCSFVISQLHPRATPTPSTDLCLVRFNAEMADDFLNASSRSNLFSALKLEQRVQMSTSPLSTTKSVAIGQAPVEETDSVTKSSPLTALIEALSVVTGMEKAEVEENVGVDDFLDDIFGIDSITSIQLGRRLNAYGYDIKADTLATSTFGAVLEHLEAAALPLPDTKQSPALSLDTLDTFSSEELLSGSKLPVSVSVMTQASLGHNLASGAIVPSMWYAMNAIEMLGPNVKIDLHRMAPVNFNRCFLRKETLGSRLSLYFETEADGSQPLLRAQASSLGKSIEPVPKFSTKVPKTTYSTSLFYDEIVRRSGFAYKRKYRSLQQVAVYGLKDVAAGDNALSNTLVEAAGSLKNDKDSDLGRVETFFVLVDAGLHPAFVCGATLAPARLELSLHVPSTAWSELLAQTEGEFSVTSRFLKSSHSVLVLSTTAYIGPTPIYTSSCTCKLLPIAVGAHIFPQFMCTAPKHTLVCFHEAGGTSRVFESLGSLLAPSGVRVLSYDFPQHGRRSQQSDDDVNPSLNEVIQDVLPFLQRILTNSEGEVDPFSVLGMSSGGIVAFGVLRDGLVPNGLVPAAFLNMTTQPAHIPNMHVERTYDATLDNIQRVLGYYSVLAGTSLMHLEEGQTTVDHVTSVLGVVHELTTNPATAVSTIDVPTYVYALVDDPVATWNDIQRWSDLLAPGCLVGNAVRELDPTLNHFLGLTGLELKAFNQIFFQDNVLQDLLRK